MEFKILVTQDSMKERSVQHVFQIRVININMTDFKGTTIDEHSKYTTKDIAQIIRWPLGYLERNDII